MLWSRSRQSCVLCNKRMLFKLFAVAWTTGLHDGIGVVTTFYSSSFYLATDSNWYGNHPHFARFIACYHCVAKPPNICIINILKTCLNFLLQLNNLATKIRGNPVLEKSPSKFNIFPGISEPSWISYKSNLIYHICFIWTVWFTFIFSNQQCPTCSIQNRICRLCM